MIVFRILPKHSIFATNTDDSYAQQLNTNLLSFALEKIISSNTMATRHEEVNVSFPFHKSHPSDTMATRYQESNASLPFDTSFTPDVMTPGDEETNNPSMPIVQPMQMGEDGPEARVLPRADGGKDAWLVLAGCFVLEALVWGFVILTTLQLACNIENTR